MILVSYHTGKCKERAEMANSCPLVGTLGLSGSDVLENRGEGDLGTEDRSSWTSAVSNLAVCTVGSGGNNICTYWR